MSPARAVRRGASSARSRWSTDARWKAYTPDRVLSDLEWLESYLGVNGIMYFDSTYFVKESRAREISQGMVDRGMKFGWAANARAPQLGRFCRRDFRHPQAKRPLGLPGRSRERFGDAADYHAERYRPRKTSLRRPEWPAGTASRSPTVSSWVFPGETETGDRGDLGCHGAGVKDRRRVQFPAAFLRADAGQRPL